MKDFERYETDTGTLDASGSVYESGRVTPAAFHLQRMRERGMMKSN